ncbi:hypothetical protein ACJX0J_010794, partial [Zea mays]
VDNRDSSVPKVMPEEAAKLCDRNFGISADGSLSCRGSMMCGNGVCCFARFIAEIENLQGTNSKLLWQAWYHCIRAGQIFHSIATGRLSISPRIFGFYTNIFGHKTKLFFLCEDIHYIVQVPTTLSSMGSPSLHNLLGLDVLYLCRLGLVFHKLCNMCGNVSPVHILIICLCMCVSASIREGYNFFIEVGYPMRSF